MITDLRAKAAERASFRVDEEAELFIGRSCALGAGLHTTSTSDTPVSVVKYLSMSNTHPERSSSLGIGTILSKRDAIEE
jgi:hypothetical protein